MGDLKFSLFFAAFISCLAFSGCPEEEESPGHVLTEIVVSPPSQVEYYLGSAFPPKPAGLGVLAKYSDNTNEAVTDYTLYYNDTEITANFGGVTKEAGTKNIVVRCGAAWGGMTGSFSVRVIKAGITGIVIDTSSMQTEYGLGEPFSSEGIIVTGTFDTGDTANLIVESTDFYGFDSSRTGSHKEVVFTKLGLTKSFYVDVLALKDRINGATTDPENNVIQMFANETLASSCTLGGDGAGTDILYVPEKITLSVTTDDVSLKLGNKACMNIEGTVKVAGTASGSMAGGSWNDKPDGLVTNGRLVVESSATSPAAITGTGTIKLAVANKNNKGYMLAVLAGKGLRILGSLTLTGVSTEKDDDVDNTSSLLYVGGEDSSLTIEESVRVYGNCSVYYAGGVWIDKDGIFTMAGSSTVTGNSAGLFGAGIWVDGGTLVMCDSASVTGNKIIIPSGLGKGAGVYMMSGKLQMHGGSIAGNFLTPDTVGGTEIMGSQLYIVSGRVTTSGSSIVGPSSIVAPPSIGVNDSISVRP